MRLPELVIFDCDGTLVDSERIANEVFAALITAEGLPTGFAECVERYMGRSAGSCVAGIERELGRPLRTDLLALRTAEVDRRLAGELTAVPGVREALEVLAAAGTPVCVASSSTPAEIEFRLQHTGLAEFFGGAVFSATTVPNGKPAPDVFLHAAKEMGRAPQDCVVVEDSVTGVLAGKAAGMRVIGFADLMAPDALRAAGADQVVRHAGELPAALGYQANAR
ncbi:HAD family hydrolase [Allokutzneria albata]|uniref:Haloacid dehalogenase superfamily, subfamily IA, variant 3 with third motif having DD or ED n=1 Tax=Allokutzneria albata TaxID=211114 RepID=A0A1G9XJG0_ALLAB|nr:HAD family phosphatase [Allokutzneria albata]SDM96413.1 haloacid dehalogenase superfamily, subfamily IA, variant 3 with third motif having DD or ED [Allokutzneria albata]